MMELKISVQVAQQLSNLSTQTNLPVDEILRRLLADYGDKLLADTPVSADAEVSWTEEEVAALIQPDTPLTGKEMVEQGFIGGWEDMEIEDSVAWVARRRARRKHKNQW